jgi:hypothetical protein
VEPLLPNGEQDLATMAVMCRETADRVQVAGGDRAAIVSAIERFLDFGDAGEYSPKELWDFFANDSPSVAGLAGCDAATRDRVIRIFATCAHARYGGGRPLPANWPWHEQEAPDKTLT